MNEAYQDALLKVDSYGAIFMYATHKDLTTAPRHIIRMTEPVDPRVLLAAVRTTLDRYPQFGLGLVRGETQYSYRILTSAAQGAADERPVTVLHRLGGHQRLSVPVRLQG